MGRRNHEMHEGGPWDNDVQGFHGGVLGTGFRGCISYPDIASGAWRACLLSNEDSN